MSIISGTPHGLCALAVQMDIIAVVMRIIARSDGVQDGIMRCAECGGPLIKAGDEYRCLQKMPPEELVALGILPSKNSEGKIDFNFTTKDQQRIQISQALSNTVEVDEAFLVSMGLDLQKIKEFQIKHGVLP
jgi:hypothetical protein